MALRTREGPANWKNMERAIRVIEMRKRVLPNFHTALKGEIKEKTSLGTQKYKYEIQIYKYKNTNVYCHHKLLEDLLNEGGLFFSLLSLISSCDTHK